MRLLTPQRLLSSTLALAGVAFAAACSRESMPVTGPMTPPSTVSAVNIPPGWTGYAAVCKVGPVGVYTIHADASSATNNMFLVDDNVITDATGQHADFLMTLLQGSGPCQDGAGRIGVTQYGEAVTLTLTETNIPAGTVPVRWDVYCDKTSCDLTTPIFTQIGGASLTYVVGATDQVKIVLTNGSVPTSSGCTPGYWKAPQHFDSWPSGYLPTQLVGTYFPNASAYSVNGAALSSYNLAQGLAFQGGSDNSGAAQILLRAAIAGMLNSASAFNPAYPVSTANLISSVNSALASNNRSTMITLATTLDGYNNTNCTLN